MRSRLCYLVSGVLRSHFPFWFFCEPLLQFNFISCLNSSYFQFIFCFINCCNLISLAEILNSQSSNPISIQAIYISCTLSYCNLHFLHFKFQSFNFLFFKIQLFYFQFSLISAIYPSPFTFSAIYLLLDTKSLNQYLIRLTKSTTKLKLLNPSIPVGSNSLP